MAPNPNTVAEVEASYFDTLVATEGEFDPFAVSGWNTIRRRFEQFVQPLRAEISQPAPQNEIVRACDHADAVDLQTMDLTDGGEDILFAGGRSQFVVQPLRGDHDATYGFL